MRSSLVNGFCCFSDEFLSRNRLAFPREAQKKIFAILHKIEYLRNNNNNALHIVFVVGRHRVKRERYQSQLLFRICTRKNDRKKERKYTLHFIILFLFFVFLS